MFEFCYVPQEDINYNFIASLYAGGCLIAIILYILDSMYEVEEVKGFWIIFCPFVPALLWSIFMKTKAAKMFTKEKDD